MRLLQAEDLRHHVVGGGMQQDPARGQADHHVAAHGRQANRDSIRTWRGRDEPFQSNNPTKRYTRNIFHIHANWVCAELESENCKLSFRQSDHLNGRLTVSASDRFTLEGHCTESLGVEHLSEVVGSEGVDGQDALVRKTPLTAGNEDRQQLPVCRDVATRIVVDLTVWHQNVDGGWTGDKTNRRVSVQHFTTFGSSTRL